jgi:hypothetical protein
MDPEILCGPSRVEPFMGSIAWRCRQPRRHPVRNEIGELTE